MARATPCKTPGAIFRTRITTERVTCEVEFPPDARAALAALSERDAQVLEDDLHNAFELVLAQVWRSATP